MSFYRISLLLFIFAHLLTTCSLHLSRLPSHSVQDSSATSQYLHLNTIPLASVLRRRFLAHHNSRSHISFLCFILLSGDIETNPGPVASHFNLCTLNIQSLADHKSLHSTAVADLAEQQDLHLIALSETWLKPDTTPSDLAECTPSGYTLMSKHRPLPKDYNHKRNLGGGLAFLIKDSLNYSLYACSSYTSFESFAITIHFGHRNLTVFNIYRPDSDSGYSEPFTTFLDQFQSFLAVAATTPHDFIITGDFNIHVNKSDSRSTQFLDILHSHNLDQLVSSPTHKHGNTLDLVITTSDSPLSATVSVYPTRPTDHFPVLSRLEVPSRTPPPIINRTFRRIHSIDVDMFMSDLLSEPLITQPPSSLSDLIGLYNSTLSSLLDKHAPLITKPISSRPSNPWFTSYLHELKATRRRMEKAWKRSSDSYHAMRLRLITQSLSPLHHQS